MAAFGSPAAGSAGGPRKAAKVMFRDLRSFSTGYAKQDAAVVTLSKRELDPKKSSKAQPPVADPEKTPQPRRRRNSTLKDEDDDTPSAQPKKIRDAKATDADDDDGACASPGVPETPGTDSRHVLAAASSPEEPGAAAAQ